MDLAYDRKDALFGPRAVAAKEIQRLAKGREKQVALEFARMAEQVDKGQAPTTADPVVRQIWQRLTQFKAEDAQFMRDNNFYVHRNPHGASVARRGLLCGRKERHPGS
jgi:hypothetical protein